MSPRTCLLLLATGLLLLSACGTPPEPLPTSPPLAGPRSSGPAGSAPAVGLPPAIGSAPTIATPTYVYPTNTYPTNTYPTNTYPTNTYPTNTYPTPTTARPASTSPATPTASYAPRCTGEPTGAQIVTLAKTSPAVPENQTVSVLDGPYCAGTWSFTTIGMTGAEPLSVIATGTGTALELITVGTDVCNPTVKKRAPAGIRAMACGS